MRRVLFILKRGECYGFSKKHSGLWNSTKFVVDALDKHYNILPKIVEVTDGNDIDRECYSFKPDICILEAIWCPPSKFKELNKLHPKIKFYVHLHSDVAFLSQEGVAISWLNDYMSWGVSVISNSKEMIKALDYSLCIPEPVSLEYLPNCYPAKMESKRYDDTSYLDIGCFGAVRPLKNQLIQAMAAIRYAKQQRKFLRFHINGTRVEHGENVLKNLRALFEGEPEAFLVEHEWVNHHEFLSLVRRMDICMQVSFSETFNICSADSISTGTPLLGSKEIEWLSPMSKVSCNKIDDIVEGIHRNLKSKILLRINQIKLWLHSRKAERMWQKFILGVKLDG